MPLQEFFVDFVTLLVAPVKYLDRVWLGILPLYITLVLGEIYCEKGTYANAVGNGFVILWAGLSWAVHLSQSGALTYVFSKSTMVIAWVVTACALGLGLFAIILGVRRKDKPLASVLGHTRFSGYFLIILYPMQAGLVGWSWPRMMAVLFFAPLAWVVIYLLGRLARVAVK